MCLYTYIFTNMYVSTYIGGWNQRDDAQVREYTQCNAGCGAQSQKLRSACGVCGYVFRDYRWALRLECVVMCCSVLQCLAVCCSALQCGAMWCSVVQCVRGLLIFLPRQLVSALTRVRCSVLQCVAVWRSALQCVAVHCSVVPCGVVCCSACGVCRHVFQDNRWARWLECVAVCCSVLPCVAVCCRVLQCVAVRAEFANISSKTLGERIDSKRHLHLIHPPHPHPILRARWLALSP